MRVYEYEAVVVGTGCAGYNCADWLYDLGVKNIAIVTEGKNKGTSRNTGSDKQTYYKLSLSGDGADGVYEMAKTLFDGGCVDGDVALCEAANSVRSFMKLAQLGVDFPTNEYGEYVGYKTDHDPYTRATSVGPYTSKKMTEVLEASVLSKGITILDKCLAIQVLTAEDKVTGLLCIDLSNRDEVEYVAIKTPHVVLATGGPASIYADSVYPLGHTGHSSLALNAGAKLCNLSEWQYGLASIDFRWNVSGTYQQVLPRYVSIDEEGVEREFLLEYMSAEEMLEKIFLKGYEWPFDVRKIHGSSYIDLLVYQETVLKGRKVYMDFTREPSGLEEGFDKAGKVAKEYLENSEALLPLPINRLKKMNAGAIELYRSHGIDIEKEPLRVAVCAQHNNGGVRINSDWETNIQGLYVAGEAAGSFGVFRPGGSALNSCQVGSMRAARSIAYRSENIVRKDFDKILEKAIAETNALIAATKGESSTWQATRKTYQEYMSKNFAFLRNPAQMQEGIAYVQERLAKFTTENKWVFVSEIPKVLKNYDIINVQEAVCLSMATAAKECGSRGSAFVCEGDFMARSPKQENTDMRSFVLTVVKEEGILRMESNPVRPMPKREIWFEKVWNEYNRFTQRRK